MKTRLLSLILVLALALAPAGCAAKPAEPAPEPEASGAAAPEPAPEPEPAVRGGLVGISLPDTEIRRWAQDGEDMRKQLEERGYEVDLQFAANDPSAQASQIGDMIADGAEALVIAAIDGGALETVLDQAREAGCAVIAYDRPIGSDAVSCYAAITAYSVGAAQGRFIADRLDLANAGDRVFNIELAGGDPGFGEPGGRIYYDGAMSVLQPYLDNGTLVVVSGQKDFEAVVTEGWSSGKAQERFENLLSTFYADRQLDAVWCEDDSVAQGVTAALENMYRNDGYPVITGEIRDIASVRNILDGRQAMSVFRDTRNLAAKTVEMADALMQGRAVPSNAEFITIDGRHRYPAFYVEPAVCTENNIVEVMLGSGYFTAEELGVEP